MAQTALAPKTEARDFSAIDRFLWNFTDTFVIARRNLLYYFRQPDLIAFSSIQPVMFILLFTYVFGGAIQTPGGEYINFLLPGILVQTVMFGGMNTAIGLTQDLSKGLIDRFRSLPMARSAVFGRAHSGDSIRNLFVVILMIAVGYIIGFRFQDGVISAIGAILLAVAYGHAISWLSALLGLFVKDPETAQVAGFVFIFPLVFASSVFVPTDTMPAAMEFFAENQPVTAIVNAIRSLTLGGPKDPVLDAVLWIAALMAIFVPLSIWKYRRTV